MKHSVQKKYVFILLILGLVLAVALPVAAQGNATGVVNTGALNVRSEPDPAATRIATIYNGTPVVVLGRYHANHWVLIRAEGMSGSPIEGWVNSNYLTLSVPLNQLPAIGPSTPPATPMPTSTPPPHSSPQPPPSTGGHLTARVTAGVLNVRGGPGVSFSVIGKVYNGQTVAVLGRAATSHWVFVRADAHLEGWVNSNYLHIGVPITHLPVLPHTPIVPGTAPLGTITTGALNVRTGPGLAYKSVGVVYQGQSVTLLARNANGSWLYVQTPHRQEGWVNTSHVDTSFEISHLPERGAPAPRALGVVSTGALNVRSGPGVDYDVVATLTYGTEVGLVGRSATGGWVKIQTENSNVLGWVNANHIHLTVPLYSLPILY